MLQETAETYEINLPGYRLVKKIGSGGYGEVWLADAPGGLTKAVKVVFGFHNENRAARELHALEKIKSARHPFLLSLESIHVVESRLVIVSELADCCLRDRFEECCRAGMSGIPRQELLNYMREAADALDYLRDKHSLQHLDVKPENLLMVSGHVKVGDFGLVKEIRQTDVSMVGGLTPTYSAPEVFQGEPSLHSDQYSLAVLYQQMLTGQLPFSGLSAAELTLQHIHDEPDLSPLPLEDRYVLAQALSKSPDQRFSSCLEFLQHLSSTGGEVANVSLRGGDSSAAARFGGTSRSSNVLPSTPTILFEETLKDGATEKNNLLVEDLPEQDTTAEPIPPMIVDAEDFQPTPCLIVGIGGTAGKVCQQLRGKLAQSFGNDGKIPAIQILALDTDRRAISRLSHSADSAGIENDETVYLPLRRPQEYRETSDTICRWLSRRWLYNIPKSLLCEGLRPLGRLAFVDNARRCVQRIRTSLLQAADRHALAESAELTKLKFRSDSVRVYLVAGVSGGTGSGMSLDLAYATKTLLEKMEFAHASITGVFVHSTGQGSRHRDLARVNAHAWLRELNQFQGHQGYYPGDEGCGIPPHPEGSRALDDVYFVHLGDSLDDEELDTGAAQVADFLFLETVTPAQRFFAASREKTREGDPPWAPLRSFAIHRCSPISRTTLDLLSQELCQHVIRAWSGVLNPTEPNGDSTASNDTDHVVCGTASMISQLNIHLEGLAAKTRAMAERQFGGCPEALLRNLLERLAQSGEPAKPGEVFKLINGFFAPPPDLEDPRGEFLMERPLETLVRPLEMKLCSAIQQWLLDRLNEPQERLDGALRGCDWFQQHFERVIEAAEKMSQHLGCQLSETITQYTPANSAQNVALKLDATHSLAVKFFRMRLDQFACQAAAHLAQEIQADLKSVQESLVEFGRHLSHFAEIQSSDSRDNANGSCFASPTDRDIAGTLRSSYGEMIQSVDKELQESFLKQHGGLFEAIMGNHRELNALLDALREACQRKIRYAANELQMRSNQGSPAPDTPTAVGRSPAQGCPARPHVLEVGGVANTLVLLPNKQLSEEEAARSRAVFGQQTSLLPLGQTETILCCEVGAIPLPHLAMWLIERRRDYLEYAARVQTRNDITWKSLYQNMETVRNNSGDACTLVISSDT